MNGEGIFAFGIAMEFFIHGDIETENKNAKDRDGMGDSCTERWVGCGTGRGDIPSIASIAERRRTVI